MGTIYRMLFGYSESELRARQKARAEARPTPYVHPPVPPPPDPYPNLPPIKNWSHPFKDKRDPLAQLTHLAKATAGFYPLGINGLWHGGVHFDAGTAGILEQSSVHCLADGEVLAYRIDQQSPTTVYTHGTPVLRPFSRNFVLVRHRLQPPPIEGNKDQPPILILYSLYMHLEDWAVYQADANVARPAFWPESARRVVKADADDFRPSQSEQRGLNVRNQAWQGKVLDLLPRGAEVVISGEGNYRRLENSQGPSNLQNPDGSLRGYVYVGAYSRVKQVAGNQYQVKPGHGAAQVSEEARYESAILMQLPDGTELTLSGEGDCLKLERINQYVHYDSLDGAPEPLALDRVVVLPTPVPVKAGDLIGHIGQYQDCFAELPERKLHLELFCNNSPTSFIDACRAWDKRLSAEHKTWLKFAKGTAVVVHQEDFSIKRHPGVQWKHGLSNADLLVPKSVIDSLPAERKIIIPINKENPGSKARNWYRLDGLFHGADQTLLNGWVCEEVGVTPWLSPWAWEGYDVIYNYDTPREMLASFQRATGGYSEAELERFGPIADSGDKGPIKSRLYDLIDRNRDGKITAVELQAAISLPAHAQSISRLIIESESEWHHTAHQWDELDQLLGHSGSTPHVNWLAEKERLKQLSWWDEAAPSTGLPGDGRVHHFHPVGVAGCFLKVSRKINIPGFIVRYEQLHTSFSASTPSLTNKSKENLHKLLSSMNTYYESAQKKANLYEVAYMLATVRHETYDYRKAEFFSEEPEVGSLSYFNKYDPVLAATPEARENARKNGNTEEGDGFKYRGRGCVHLTWKKSYKKFSELLSFDFVADPDAAARFEYSVPIMIIGMTEGVFTGKKLSHYFNSGGVDYVSARWIINGKDKRDLIASYADIFESILKQTSSLSLDF